ncbi:MAG: prolyl-tRNA synthetase associated domain-containing protein [Oscillospiraceae bacterium]|jgi:Ala-tRNA(Pro) deacylase|nr:prolyl-tRNA synthetase associated domain-containing protein [Oscillospiraceae bacterium]
MTENIQNISDLLTARGVDFTIIEHPAVFTIDDLLALNLLNFDAVAKNLFVRDDKKRNYYLVVVRHDKKLELKAFSEKIGSTKLSFASENDLGAILKLQKGAVTPFGILNDDDRRVKVIIDKSFDGAQIGVHPNENTASVWLDASALVAIIKEHGNKAEFLEI